MKFLLKKRAGESFIEILVSLFIVALSITVALNLLLNTADATNTNRNFLIGDNLATEGLESIYNIIYTNILKHGVENVDECWLVFPTDAFGQDFFANECPDNQIVGSGQPELQGSFLKRDYSNVDLHWDIERATDTELDLENEPDDATKFRLYTATFTEDENDPLFGSFYYTNEIDDNRPSSFYRSVTMKLDPTLPNEVAVGVLVQWREAGRVRQIQKTATINNSNFVEQ